MEEEKIFLWFSFFQRVTPSLQLTFRLLSVINFKNSINKTLYYDSNKQKLERRVKTDRLILFILQPHTPISFFFFKMLFSAGRKRKMKERFSNKKGSLIWNLGKWKCLCWKFFKFFILYFLLHFPIWRFAFFTKVKIKRKYNTNL